MGARWTRVRSNPSMDQASGFSVRIFIPSGDPEGLRVISKSNWSGEELVFPRSLFGDVRHREELDRTGVYMLRGPGETEQLPRVYVGEGDVLVRRLDNHFKNVFEKPRRPTTPDQVLHLQGKGIRGEGYQQGDNFVVHKGSEAVKEEVQQWTDPEADPECGGGRRRDVMMGVRHSSCRIGLAQGEDWDIGC